MTFQNELEKLINKYSVENESNTPDFILAEYLCGCLKNYAEIIKKREKWYGNSSSPAMSNISSEEPKNP
jgi:hypothetical protein